MTHALFTKHEDTLKHALAAIESRGYWARSPKCRPQSVRGKRERRW